MLELTIQGEFFDEKNNRFITIGPRKVRFEHSLLSLSKWEERWQKPFLNGSKTSEETIDYIRLMAMDDISELELSIVMSDHFHEINEYIDSKRSATVIKSHPSGRNSEVVTSELIYYWMFSAGIPADPCERWHLSRLLTLIEIFGIKNSPKKKMPKGQVSKMYRTLNAQRRAQLGTSG